MELSRTLQRPFQSLKGVKIRIKCLFRLLEQIKLQKSRVVGLALAEQLFDDEVGNDTTLCCSIDWSSSSSSRADKERSYERELWPKDIVQDEEVPYENEKECAEAEPKVKANVLPQVLEIPICRPPGDQDKMHTIKLSNIVGIDPRPFDPRTYVKHDFFATDKSGFKRYIPSQNIIRWRNVKNPDGTTSVS
ncbi:Uncharacterized protein Fot_30083 [Forsythia ovata]|uniref:Uncharacterized protein n=1 Tax=Forsythia ovata TaxID=205694 RepID=A0ABD1TTQ1_9LAMI